MNELLKCPFCEKDGLLIKECNLPDEEYVMYYILCDYSPYDTRTKKFHTREDAIEH